MSEDRRLDLSAIVATAVPALAHVDAEASSAGGGATTIEFSFTHATRDRDRRIATQLDALIAAERE